MYGGEALLREAAKAILGALVLAAGPRDDARDDAVAPERVGHADDGDLGHRVVLAQGLFDLERAELVAAALEDVDARAPEDAQVAVRRRARPCRPS